MPRFKIRHITRYQYEVPVRDSANQIMLYPLRDEHQDVQQQQLVITGEPTVFVYEDYYGNQIGTFSHPHPHQTLEIDSRLLIVTQPKPLPELSSSPPQLWTELANLGKQPPFLDFLKQEHFQALPDVQKMIAAEHHRHASPLTMAQDFCGFVYQTFAYQKGITTVETTIDEIWNLKSGVCQDFAHILLAMLRLSQIPARYVSGYICPNKSGMRGEGATHAWVEAYLPQYGWLGLDPTNNCIANETHVRLAVGRNYGDCAPVKGTYRGTSAHVMEVAVSVGYEDGHTSEAVSEVVEPPPVATVSTNSYRRQQEAQMQQ
jgi:transglutaminase-like putative cysteine protease